LKCNEVMHLAYLWLTGCSVTTIIAQTAHSKPTITNYMGHFRQLVSTMIDTDDTIVGGPGITVQVDETKMGKRKYHRGHRVEGAWVLVGVELTSDRKIFAEVVNNRTTCTIAEVLGRHLAAGSILQTDCWKGYGLMGQIFNIEHLTVNHSQGFINKETEVHTNVVEGSNYALKKFIPPRNRTKISLPSFLDVFVWRRKNHDTLWKSYLVALRNVSY
jgi:hypothetical protein